MRTSLYLHEDRESCQKEDGGCLHDDRRGGRAGLYRQDWITTCHTPTWPHSGHHTTSTHLHTQTGILSNDQFDVNCKYAKNIYEFTFKCFCNFNLFIPFLSLETKIKVTKATQLQLFLILRLCEGFIKVFYFYIQSREIN